MTEQTAKSDNNEQYSTELPPPLPEGESELMVEAQAQVIDDIILKALSDDYTTEKPQTEPTLVENTDDEPLDAELAALLDSESDLSGLDEPGSDTPINPDEARINFLLDHDPELLFGDDHPHPMLGAGYAPSQDLLDRLGSIDAALAAVTPLDEWETTKDSVFPGTYFAESISAPSYAASVSSARLSIATTTTGQRPRGMAELEHRQAADVLARIDRELALLDAPPAPLSPEAVAAAAAAAAANPVAARIYRMVHGADEPAHTTLEVAPRAVETLLDDLDDLDDAATLARTTAAAAATAAASGAAGAGAGAGELSQALAAVAASVFITNVEGLDMYIVNNDAEEMRRRHAAIIADLESRENSLFLDELMAPVKPVVVEQQKTLESMQLPPLPLSTTSKPKMKPATTAAPAPGGTTPRPLSARKAQLPGLK